jgi:hypothetical protein
MPVEMIPVIYRQVGWMICVACSDSRTMRFGAKKGQMWLGKNHDGSDIWIDCPVCKGTGETPRYQTLDARTGEEIDYEGLGRDRDGNPIPIKIVPVDGPVIGE